MQKFYDEIIKYVPDHMKNDDDFNKIIKIYCDCLEENYEYSGDALQVRLVDKLKEKYNSTKEERYSNFRNDILRGSLNEMFSTVDAAGKSIELYDRLADTYAKLGMSIKNIDMIKMVDKIMTQQNIIVNKSFNMNKGKYTGYMYIFELIDKAQIDPTSRGTEGGFLEILEGTEDNPKQPFTYRVNTSIYTETYEALVKPLVHPIGFGYAVSTLLYLMLEDYFSIEYKQTLNFAKIRCLQPNGSYTEIDLMAEYDVVDFSESEGLNGSKKFILKVKDKETKENLNFVLDYDSSVTLYGTDNLNIINVELVIPQDGIIDPVYEKGAFVKASYNQYFINRKTAVKVRFQIEGDTKNNIYVANIPIDIDSLPKVEGKNYVEAIEITYNDLRKYVTEEIKGRVVTEYPRSCGLEYDITREYVSTLKEELEFKKNFRMEDWWDRKNYYTYDIVNIGNSLTAAGAFWIPVIGEFNVGGYTEGNIPGNARSNRMEKCLFYNMDYKELDLPKIDFLGRDENYWINEQPIYDQKIDNSYMQALDFHYQDYDNVYQPAWEILTSHQSVLVSKAPPLGQWYITQNPRYIEDKEYNVIGDNYTDEEYEKIWRHEIFPEKGDIGHVGFFIHGVKQVGDWYLSKKELFVGGFDIGDAYTDDEFQKIKNKQIYPSKGNVMTIGHKLIPGWRYDSDAEYWDYFIEEEFFIEYGKKIIEKLALEDSYIWNDDILEHIATLYASRINDKKQIKDWVLHKTEDTTIGGGWTLGTPYGQKEIEYIFEGKIKPTHGAIKLIGGIYEPEDFGDDLELVVQEKIAQLDAEDERPSSQGYSELDIEMIKKCILISDRGEVTDPKTGITYIPKWHQISLNSEYYDHFVSEEFHIRVTEEKDNTWTYTNKTPVPNDVLGVPAGTTFNRVPIKKLWNMIVYGVGKILGKE